MLHNVAHGVLYKYQNEGVVRNLSKKVQLTKIYGLVFIAAAFFSSAILAPVQPAGAASVTITTTKISPAQKPVSLTGSSFVVNYCNEDKDGGTNDCDNGITPVTFNKEGGKFIARDVDYSDRTSLITRNTCNYNINVWYGANSSTANLTPEYRGGGPCSQFSERSIAVIPANITLAPPAKIQLGGVHHALYIPSDHPPVDISGNSISLKFCQLNTLNKNVDNTTRPTTSACPSVGTVTLYKQGDAFVENSIDISGAAYTCNYGLRAVIGQGAGNVTISKNGGNPCPDGVDDGNTTFTISSASMCESKYPAGSVRDACMAGALDANKANDAFCDETYAGKPAELTACKAGQDATKNLPPPEADDSSGEQASTCTVEAVGWLVCPVMKFTATLNDGLSGFLFSSLEFKAEFLKTDSGAYKAWQSFLNIANVMFVIAFMAIVLSQVTSIGISNYGIKKLLPKLVIVAILVNISYYICQLAVDISNLLGYSLKELLDSVRPATTATGVNWVEIIGLGLMSGVALIGLFLAISVPVLFAAFLSLASAALIIFAQKSIVILLTVLSPLAFVAMLLPNTEKLFKRWREIFTSMLILFPTVSLLFGAGNLASAILMEAAGDDPGMKIAALGAGVLPLLAIIPLLQNALKSTGALGAKLSGLNQKANSRFKNKVGESRLGETKSAFQRRTAINRANARAGNGTLAKIGRGLSARGATRLGGAVTWAGTRQRALDQSRLGKIIGGDRGSAAASALVREQEKKDAANIADRISRESLQQPSNYTSPYSYATPKTPKPPSVTYLQDQLDRAIQQQDTALARAAMNALKASGETGVTAIQETLQHHATQPNSRLGDTAFGTEIRSVINSEHGDLKEKDVRITNYGASGDVGDITSVDYGGLTDRQIASQTTASLSNASTTLPPTSQGRPRRGLDAPTRARVIAAADAGQFDLKQSKRHLF